VGRSVYIAGFGEGGGKSTVALGLAELLSRQVGRIGAFRPLVTRPGHDPILDLLRERYAITLPAADLHGMTYAEAAALAAAGDREELISRIVERYRAVEGQVPAMVVIGSDLEDSDDPRQLGFNARLATELGSVAVAVVDGQTDDPASAMSTAYHSLTDLGATVLAVIANRAPAGVVPPDLPVPAYVIPEVPTVSAPTVGEVATALGAQVLAGDARALDRDVLDYVVGGAHVPAFLDHLTDGCLVITPGDRADLLLAASSAHASGMVAVAGVMLTLGEQPDERVMRLINRLDTGLAVLSVGSDSYHTVAAASRIEGRPSASSPRKVEAALGAFESNVNTAALADRLQVARSSRVTPLMFEYDLIDRARSARRPLRSSAAGTLARPDAFRARPLESSAAGTLARPDAFRSCRLVLPEGTEERILRATEILLRRGVADLTLLGNQDEIARRVREIGVDIAGATVVDPATSPWRDEFAATYAKLRSHKGVTLDLAHDVVADPNYFGTLMVLAGQADGMVSGSTHTTAATIRPAFEVIKTVPGVSVASSVFFMLLADRVLVYGDCAVNPDPEVAAAKLPDSEVAGHATVFIFPDLNTGNNTYKAVQRSAGAVAVGPVMQGLRRPVNDLSRGATVKDIVNTVAITAIQAAAR
jgi:phosphate acetyltransferase